MRRQPRVQVSVVTEHGLYDIVVELVVEEECVVRFEEDVCTVLVFCRFSAV